MPAATTAPWRTSYPTQTEKGEYVAVRRQSGGAPAGELLAALCPAIITALPFGKRMRWGTYSLAYARPLRWVLALLDDQVVPFALGLTSGGKPRPPHPGPGPFAVARQEFCPCLPVPAASRWTTREREIIVAGGEAQAAAVQGKILWKDSLLDEVQGLTEHPVPLLADFDPAYLEVPREVLLTSMESHQKSFGIEGPDGKLLPYFLTVLNLTPEDMGLVKRGWERVLRARLEDARFFWRADLRESFEHWLQKLDAVIFIRRSGEHGRQDQTAGKTVPLAGQGLRAAAGRSVDAARPGGFQADLVSAMVGGVRHLQGRHGRHLRRAERERHGGLRSGRQCPPAGPALNDQSGGGAALVADKADTLAGCFGLGMIPTGAADPNGLRRCAAGIIRIMLQIRPQAGRA